MHNLVCQRQTHFNSVAHLAKYREDIFLLAKLFDAVNKFKEREVWKSTYHLDMLQCGEILFKQDSATPHFIHEV